MENGEERERRRLDRTRRSLRLTAKIFKRVTIAVAVVFGTFVLSLGAVVGFAWWKAGSDIKKIPALADPAKAPLPQPVAVYSSDGVRLGSTVIADRTVLPPTRITKLVRDAFISVEDQRFYHHRGVDPVGLARAAWADIKGGKPVQGASTVTMQYVRNVYLDFRKTFLRKLREGALALQLESVWTKDRILTAYLNTIYLGAGAYGVEAASRRYFGVHAWELRPDQAAMLAGIVQRPTWFDPYERPKAVLARRNLVLDEMYNQGFLSTKDLLLAKTRKLGVRPLEADRRPLEPMLFNVVKHEADAVLRPEQVKTGGYSVKSTIDLGLVNSARSAIRSQYTGVEDRPAVAMAHVDPQTGAILALAQTQRKIQLAYAAQTQRQPGSTVKPFTTAAWLMNGGRLSDPVDNSPVEIKGRDGKPYTISPTKSGIGKVSDALRYSQNPAFYRLFQEVGPSRVLAVERTLGLKNMDANPAAALGGVARGTNPLEMSRAFATFANDGRSVPSHTVDRISDPLGNVLYQFKPPSKQRQDIPTEVARQVNGALRQVVDHGFAKLASSLDVRRRFPLAGKTGTTEDHSDAWFVGYTPRMAGAVWTGYPKRRRSMESVLPGGVWGSTVPAQVFNAYAEQAFKRLKLPAEEFAKPAGLIEVPPVVGRDIEDAKALLARYRVRYALIPKAIDKRTPGAVTRVVPGPGTWQPPENVVEVEYATPLRPVPDVVGMDYLDARRELADFAHVRENIEVAGGKPDGTVVSVEPPPGSPADIRGTVLIGVAMHRPPAKVVTKTVTTQVPTYADPSLKAEVESLRTEVTVPDVTDLNSTDARAVLNSLGLSASATGNGTVTRQNPRAGTRLRRDSTVFLTVP